ncbi:MAG: PD40 domain-containing protein [Iphinoe sp. HA4291-MV1]|jgi:WD40 repeat protein/energy-coupling factor transporter ATP-binding protein EcfA2|nr:PD40 domain-containing protein [Iphinoe sp. HA4291-MV1]
MSQPLHPEENSPPTQQPILQQQVENATLGGGMQAIQGERNIQFQGDSNIVTLNQTQILQISVEEIKTRQFIQTSPYKGLKKFEPEDKDLFFGRDQFLTGLVNELEQTNLILLLGASGSGKSSIVRAGLIPWLSQKWGSQLVHLMFTPDVDPFESFYANLLGKYKQAEAQIAREAKLGTLTQVVTRLKQPDDYWFIFIDQFEELFTTSEPQKRDQFITSLVQLSKTKQHSVKIMATMRADFLDRLSPYSQLVKVTDKHRPFIAEMQRDELRLAIEQPAAQHGVVFEVGLVEEIIKNVQGQAGYLPLLQYTLNLLWETEVKNHDIQDRTLNISTYRQLGGVWGALQQRVEKIYNNLTKVEQTCTQRIFLKLVEIGGDEESGQAWKPVRRRAMRFEFNEKLEQEVLTQLIDQNLLVSNRQPQSEVSTVEIAHEALLTSWTQLNEWIGENRQAIALRNRLNEDVAHWQITKADDELWSGSRLEQVLELRQNEAFHQILGGFGDVANQFIDASVGRRDRQRRNLIIRLSVFSGMALALAAFSTIQYQRAETGQVIAQRETAEARFALNKNTFDALLVGIDAAKHFQSLIWGNTNPQMQAEMRSTLGQAVYWTRERNRLEGHKDVIQSVSFSPDGQMLATASYDNTVKLWRSDGSLITTLEGHTQPVMSISFSRDGQMFASGSLDGTVRLWNRNGKLIRFFKTDNNSVFSVRFSPDGKTIATGNEDKTAKLWGIDGRLLKTLEGHRGLVRQVSFSSDGNRIVTVSDDKTVKLWSWDGKLLKTLDNSDFIASADFSPDSQILATASLDKTVKLWNQEGKLLQTLKHPEQVWSVSFSADRQTIASGSKDGIVRLWARDGKLLDTWKGHKGAIPSIAFSPDGKMLATAGNDGITKFWQVNRSWLTVLVGHQNNVFSARFSPDGKRIASASFDGTVKIWSREGQLLSTLKEHQGKVNSVSFSPDGQTIASAGDDNTIKLWSVNVDRQAPITLRGHEDRIISVSFSSDGKMIASASADGTAKLWSLDGKELRTLKGHRARVLSVAFSSDGQTIATAGDDKIVKLWSSKGKELGRLKGHASEIWSVGFSRDGQTIITTSGDKTIKLWQRDGRLITTLIGHTASVLDANFSPDGKMIASASSDGTIKLWQRDGKLITTLIGHQTDVYAVSFSPDSKWLASAGADKVVLLWNMSDLSLKGLQEKGCSQIRDYLNLQSKSSNHLCN